MQLTRDEEGFVFTERCTSKLVQDELRTQEEDCLSLNGEGLLPGLTKAFRASRINHHPAPLS